MVSRPARVLRDYPSSGGPRAETVGVRRSCGCTADPVLIGTARKSVRNEKAIRSARCGNDMACPCELTAAGSAMR